jgi:hypothetical protein
MNARVAKLRGAITAALARYEAWERPLRSYRGRATPQLNRGEFNWEEFDRGLRELETSLRAAGDPRDELAPLLDALCAEYVESSPAGRVALREFVAKQQKLGGLLWRYANALTRRVATADDRALVTRALAAASIEDCASDVRDTLMTLADLFVAAEGAGIDPRPLFATAAEWSTDEFTRGGCESVAGMLREFHACSVLRERRSLPGPYGGPT